MLGKYDSYMSIIYMTNPGYKILVNMKMIIRARAALFRRNKNSISERIVW